jgi:transposase InsO family protein
MMIPVFGSSPNVKTAFGHMTSSITAPMTEELLRTLNILDEFSRECLAIRVKRKLNSRDVVDVLTDLFILRDVPLFIRSDNGPEFITDSVRNWIAAVGAKTVYIEPN